MPITVGRAEQVGADAPAQTGQEVEDQEARLAQEHLDRRAHDEQGQHVEQDVQEAGVQPHGREGPVVLPPRRAPWRRPTARTGRSTAGGGSPSALEDHEHEDVDGDDGQHDRRRVGRAHHAGVVVARVGEGRHLVMPGALLGAGRALPPHGRLHHAVGADGAVAVGAEHGSAAPGVAVARRGGDGPRWGCRLRRELAHRMPARSSERTRSATWSGSPRSQRPGEPM